jgi:hypothetical protein
MVHEGRHIMRPAGQCFYMSPSLLYHARLGLET